jgi:predicted nuclease of predicted toxin-antitoxin system
MKFICDVHISYKLQRYLISQGHVAFHVNELPEKWNTRDKDICHFADTEDCIIITKDADFIDTYYIKKSPRKLIKINLGNIATFQLIQLLSEVLPLLQNVMQRERFLMEVDKDGSFTVDQTI